MPSMLLALALAATAPTQDPRPFEIADYYATSFVGAPHLDPSGERVAFSVRSYDFDAGETWSEIWMMNADGSELRQMTFGRHSNGGPSFSPDGKTLLFSSNRAGGGQLFVMPVDGGEPRQLTEWPMGLSDAKWTPDGRHIIAASDVYPECGADPECNEGIETDRTEGGLSVHVADELLYRHWTGWRDGKYTHLLMIDGETGDVVRDLTPGFFDSPVFSLGGRSFDISPDGKELCFVSNREAKAAESTNADLWLLDLENENAEPRNATRENRGWDGAPLYSPDGQRIAYVSQHTPGYESDLRRLAVYDRSSGKSRYLTERGGFDQMVDDMQWKPDGRALVIQAEMRGRNPLLEIPVEGGMPRGVHQHAYIGGWELDATAENVIYSRRSIGEPPEIFRASLSGGQPKRLTTFNAELEAEVDIRPAEEMWVRGAGDYDVHVFLVKPHGFDPSKRYPLILNVHGGPQGQWSDAYRGDWQVYPGKGYVLAFANPTGSTGYGQDLVDGIACDWGGRVFDDLMLVTDAVAELDYVDEDRMGAMGWSYGGYMMMWFQGHTDRFKCQASMMGLYDLRSFYGATEELWFPEKDLCGTPWTSDDYERWSPSNYVEEFRTPALVIAGELDYRVPYTQSLQYFTALQKQGVDSRLVMFPNAGHWPGWQEMAFYYNAHLDWFHRYLGGDPAPYDVREHARNRKDSGADDAGD